jgi:3-hexulose-6-phosphate synthase
MTLLHLALDAPEAFAVEPHVRDCVDVIEVETPLLKRFGVGAAMTVRELAPGVPVLSDAKTEGSLQAVAAPPFPSSVPYESTHVPTDARLPGAATTSELAHRITQLRDAGLAVSAAGGISRETIDEVAAASPASLVVGGAVTIAQDPRKEALWLRQRLGP